MVTVVMEVCAYYLVDVTLCLVRGGQVQAELSDGVGCSAPG